MANKKNTILVSACRQIEMPLFLVVIPTITHLSYNRMWCSVKTCGHPSIASAGGPTLFLPVCHVWNIVSTRHENVRFQQRAKRAGTPGKTLVLETEVYPKYSILGHKNWLWLCLKLTIESPDRCDYHFKAQVEVKLYDRQKAKLLCTRTACHNIQEEGDGKFFVELIPYTEIESQDCQELEIYINVTVTSRRVSFLLTDYMLPETKEEERAYVNIDVSKPSD